MTGGQLVSEDLGLALGKIDVQHFGRAKKVIIEREKTTIIEGAARKGAVQDRVDQINAQMEQTTSTYDKTRGRHRHSLCRRSHRGGNEGA